LISLIFSVKSQNFLWSFAERKHIIAEAAKESKDREIQSLITQRNLKSQLK